MRIGEIFGSYMKFEDLHGRPLKGRIKSIEVHEFKDEKTGKTKKKPVLFLDSIERPFVAGPIVSGEISEFLGSDDTDDWWNREIEIFTSKTPYGGKLVDCMRVRKPSAAASANGERQVVREVKAPEARREANIEEPADLPERRDDADREGDPE